MGIPFIDLRREYTELRSEINEAVLDVLNSGSFLLGQQCENFEQDFAKYCNIGFSLGVSSGTDALVLSLMALDVGYGDHVVTVPNTAIPTVAAISMVGAKPVFVDVDAETMLMDPEKLEDAISRISKKERSRIKAIIPVHLYGSMCSMDQIKKVGDKYRIPIIEDCAQAHGAEYNGKKAGTIGLAGCYSFYPTKNLSCYGDGGCIITRDKTLYERLKTLRNYGLRDRYHQNSIGIGSRLDEIQAAILNIKLGYLEQYNVKRRLIALKYMDGLKNCPVTFQKFSSQEKRHVFHLMVLRSKHRDAIVKYLSDNSVESFTHYPIPIYLQNAYRFLDIKKATCPVAEKTCESVFSLPLYPYLKNEEIQIVIDRMREFFRMSHRDHCTPMT